MTTREYTNGVAHGTVVPRREPERRDPLAHVLAIGADVTWVGALAVAGALVVHGAAATRAALIDPWLLDWAGRTGLVIEGRLAQTIDVSTEKEPPPPPPVEEPKEEEPRELAPAPVERNPYDDVKPATPPPPSAAEASQVLTASDDTLDFTGNTIVVGNAATYAGGKTTREGTSKRVEKVGGPGGGGNGPENAKPSAPAPDLSRAVALAGSSDWKCPWPGEADAEQMDEAKVEIEVAVGPDGRATRATVLADPGFGFGREAKACALRQSYAPALDRDGKAVAATKKFRVRFER